MISFFLTLAGTFT